MEATDRQAPTARSEGLVVHELPDEVLVYDLERHRAHSLNRAAALIWGHCDGKTTLPELASLLHHELDLPQDEELVWLALNRLGRAHLLKERMRLPTGVPSPARRALLRNAAVAGGLALVSSIVAPKAEAAGSPCVQGLGTCKGTNTCCCVCANGTNMGCQASLTDCKKACPNGSPTCV